MPAPPKTSAYGVAFLGIDLNENGTIDSGQESIGGQMFSTVAQAIAALDRLAPLLEQQHHGEIGLS